MVNLDLQRIQNLRKAHIDKKINEINSADAKLVCTFTPRFSVYEDDNNYYFFDKYWLNLTEIQKIKIKVIKGVQFNIGLFIQGFLPFVLEVPGLKIKDRASYDGDNFFWQFPCATERDFFERNIRTKKIHFSSAEVNVYVPMPWATFIDSGSYNAAVIETIASRLRYATKYLRSVGYKVRVHTCCQHVRWQDAFKHFNKLAITDLWISHKKKNEDYFQGMDLHAWSLYATNYEDESRSQGLTAKSMESKKFLASFVGAYMPHYLSSHRLALKKLNVDKSYRVVVSDVWHYEKIVYQGQMKALDEKSLNELTDESSVYFYNKTLSDSVFSLCPEGAGPNTIRIWESLAIGSIPVVISDSLEIPCPKGFKKDEITEIIVKVKSEDLESIDNILRNINVAKVKSMQIKGVAFYKRMKNECILNRVGS